MVLSTTLASPAAKTGTRGAFRTDIQGLRALAVTLVVLDHAFHWPQGGFLGVDVFYVISGFLITGLLLKELDATGSISLRGFYARRVRRIVPVAMLVLAVTVVAAFALWFFPRALQTLVDAISAALFVSNWHFIGVGANYLQARAVVSPVQHYWSLSIEEQFYAIWPLALLLIFVVSRGSKRWLAIIIVLGIVASSAIAAYATAANPSAAYFLTFGRAWELLVGALIALLGVAGSRVPDRVRHMLSGAGLALIVLGAIVVTPNFGLPYPWVIPAVAGASLVLWANAHASPRSLLGNRVSQWLGDVSYSLYLWHFPILIFAFSIFGDSWVVALACIPVMLVLSELSRRFVEQRILRGGFLRRASKIRNDRPFVRKDLLLGVGVFVAIAVLSLAQVRGPVVLRSADEVASLIGVGREPNAQQTPAVERTQDIVTALQANAWPSSIRAQLDAVFALQNPDAMRTESPGCRNNVFTASAPMVCGADTAASAMVVGDSVALAWVPAVEAATGHAVTALGFANCSLIDARVTNTYGSPTPGFPEACAERRAEMLALIDQRAPETLFLSSAESAPTSTGLPLAEAEAEWEAGVARTLAKLADVPLVVLLSNPPATVDPRACATHLTGPSKCVAEVSAAYKAKARAESAAAAQFPNVVFVDTRYWYCADSKCPAFIAGELIRTDSTHLTSAASQQSGSLIAAALKSGGFSQ